MYKYYNNNPLKRNVNDCCVRAIALATGRTWDETYKQLSDFARIEGITFSEVEFIDDYLSQRYEKYCPIKGQDFITLEDFLKAKLPGRWLVTMSGHITAVIDGICYDTFNPSKRFIHCIYKVE